MNTFQFGKRKIELFAKVFVEIFLMILHLKAKRCFSLPLFTHIKHAKSICRKIQGQRLSDCTKSMRTNIKEIYLHSNHRKHITTCRMIKH